MTDLEKYLEEQNYALREKLERAYRRIGYLNRELITLKGNAHDGHWKLLPKGEKGSTQVWLWEGGAQ